MDQIDRALERRERARVAADDRAQARLDRKVADADKLIGTLVRDGKPVLYVYPPGGKYREGAHHELVAFLIRNRYV